MGIPVLGSIVEGLIGGGSALAAAKVQAAESRRAAREQMAFQERMRGTQYQTAIADLKAAGLNPMLAYEQGGAGTPSGAQAQVPDYGNVVSSALDALRLKSEIAVMRATKDRIDEETDSVKLDNYQKSAWMGVKTRMFGEGLDSGVPESSAFAAEMRRARELAAMAVYERGLAANAYSWRNVNQTARTLNAAADAFAKIRFGASGFGEAGRRVIEGFGRQK